jgi:hypothetical protein
MISNHTNEANNGKPWSKIKLIDEILIELHTQNTQREFLSS